MNGVLGCFYIMERKELLFCLRIIVLVEDLVPGIVLFLCQQKEKDSRIIDVGGILFLLKLKLQ
jgi:hypothetical protein